ncbi:MAG: DUF2299 family protein [Candidatus Thermoplasmatota archaeon]|nr:DUF2299 family protein [Candidatus Thermoplasmatota archaeon]MEC8142878.1 DUF2299 family protein [Candidatus Thermoplasmatota archaeon]
MVDSGHVQQIRQWLASERLEIRDKNDPRADAHFLVRYPPGPQGHMFAVVLPKGRDLVFVSSMTRVDLGQQEQMKEHMNEEPEVWSEWVHECRLTLMRAELDWGIHMGHQGKEKPGPLQAFNVSLPIWHDGLNKNALMHSLRRLWLAKLSMIHEIKFAYGPGKGEPGPVDDWTEQKKRKQPEESAPEPAQIEYNDTMPFGTGLDPDEWA